MGAIEPGVEPLDAAAAGHWQAVFDRSAGLYAGLADGSRMGLVARSALGAVGGRHAAGVAAMLAGAAGPRMLAFEAREGAIEVRESTYSGYARAGVEILFAVDDAALARMRGLAADSVLGALKLALRTGDAMFYVFRTKYELQDAGYEDFLDTLGLAFRGACR